MNYLQVKDFDKYTKHSPEAIVKQYYTSLLYKDGETILDAINKRGLERTIKYLSDVLDVQIRVKNQRDIK